MWNIDPKNTNSMNPPLYAWTGATQHFNENQYHLVRAVILQNGDKPGLNILSILGLLFNLCTCLCEDDTGGPQHCQYRPFYQDRRFSLTIVCWSEDDIGGYSTVNIGPPINLCMPTQEPHSISMKANIGISSECHIEELLTRWANEDYSKPGLRTCTYSRLTIIFRKWGNVIMYWKSTFVFISLGLTWLNLFELAWDCHTLVLSLDHIIRGGISRTQILWD